MVAAKTKNELAVPVVSAKKGTVTFATKWGEGPSQHSVHPSEAIDGIREGVRLGLEKASATPPLELPSHFVLEVAYKDHARAFSRSFYPGATRPDPHRIRIESSDYFEVLRALMFVI